jgi:hypothetical protein
MPENFLFSYCLGGMLDAMHAARSWMMVLLGVVRLAEVTTTLLLLSGR